MRFKQPPKTAAETIQRAGGTVDVGNAGKKGASIVVTPGSKNPNPKAVIAGKKVVKVRVPATRNRKGK